MADPLYPPGAVEPPDTTYANTGLGHRTFAIDIGLLCVRAALAGVLIWSASRRLFGQADNSAIRDLARSCAASHLPLFSPMRWAYAISAAEVLVGVLVLVGACTRIAALAVLIGLWGQMAAQHGHGLMPYAVREAIPLAALSAMLILGGPGIVSCDAFLFRRGLWSRGPQPLGNARPVAPS